MNYVLVEHVIDFHKYVIEVSGGDSWHYRHTLSSVESILAQQYTYFGVEKYPTVHDKAATLMYMLAKNHCFVDGNKRIGLQIAMFMLSINGYDFTATEEQKVDKMLEIANFDVHESSYEGYLVQLSQWLKKYSKIESD